ncbi:MAG: diguanylate cyclase [Deltaproteobacteria bacterium]|nr:diguanylate cyclase [Deltaproteobacteria bacterium]
MTTLEYTVFTIRRGARLTGAFLFAGAFAGLAVAGVFGRLAADPLLRFIPLALVGAWAVVFGMKARDRFAAGQPETRSTARADLELGLLLVVATHAVVQMAGGLDSPLYPLVFVLVAFLVVYTREWVGFTLVGVTIAIELCVALLDTGPRPLQRMLVHAVFIVFFALINLVFTRTEVARTRRRAERHLAKAKADIARDARDFRFVTAPARATVAPLSREEEAARLTCSAVSEVRRAMFHHVDLLKRTMGLNTCLILWLDDAGEKLRILECVSDAGNLASRCFDKGEGAVGAVLQGRSAVRMTGLKPGYGGLPYYEGASKVTDFLGVPVFECESLRGALVADRVDGRPFGDVDQENLEAAIESLLRITANERIFTQLERTKAEQGKLLRASEGLSGALTEPAVVEAALGAVAEIAAFDVAAVALADGNGRQVVHKAVGDGTAALKGETIGDNSSLAASALKNRHYLPYRGEFDPGQQIVFSKKTQRSFAHMRSALVLPLASGEELLGTLVIASKALAAYGDEVRTTLQVMTNQLGTALLNARMVRRLEEMATTDGLTGLPNHRVFQVEMDRKMASAIRFNKELTVILGDVDKFKGVNDTYGHPVGDQVLRAVGEILRRNVVRETDLPARYGGEEFAVVCEGTGTEGARKLAERIRKDLEAHVFHTEQGDLRVTMSMGIATFPDHGRGKHDLVEKADNALYAAKEGGRNQVRIWARAPSHRDSEKA